ncbi:MAG: T9SS type A sorting domain-containing protein, partial [bacterium]|nr:T9SS type A sorting domain-containing protein [bacterium]
IGLSEGLEGFNIHRSVARSSGYKVINDELLEPAAREYTDASAEPGVTYWYKLGAVAVDGEYVSVPFRVTIGARFALHQNYPNPLNPRTTLSFYLPVKQWVTLALYDVAGRTVRTLVARNMAAGSHTLEWDSLDDDGGRVASGVYFYRLTAGKRTLSRKLVVLK